jgi:Immunity protein 8
MFVGPSDGSGEESFDITVCTAEWLAHVCRKAGGIYNPRHHLVVDFGDFDKRALHAWLAARVQEVQADTWAQVGDRLSRLAIGRSRTTQPECPRLISSCEHARCPPQMRTLLIGTVGDTESVNHEATVTLWRPTGPEELALVEASGWTAWPRRLPEQPIFYPVLNED